MPLTKRPFGMGRHDTGGGIPQLRRWVRRKLAPIALAVAVVALSTVLWIVEPVGGLSHPASVALVFLWLLFLIVTLVAESRGFFADVEFAHALALEGRGRLPEAERNYGHVIGHLRRARGEKSRELLRHSLLHRCYVLRDLGRLTEALRDADELIPACDGGDDAGSINFAGVGRTARADILMRLGDDRAREAFEDVIVRYADHQDASVRQVAAFAINKLGTRLDESGDYVGALATYDLAVYRFCDDPDPVIRSAVATAILNRGRAYRRMGQPLEAVNEYERVIGTYANEDKALSTVIWARTDVGLCLTALGRFGEALDRFDEVLATGAHDPAWAHDLQVAKALCGKGLALTQLGRTDEAQALYEKVIASFREDEAPAELRLASEKVAALRETTGEV